MGHALIAYRRLTILTKELSLGTTLILIYIIGYIGYIIFKKIKIPAAGIIGSLVANAAVSLLGVNFAELPVFISVLLQITIGIIAGSQFSKERNKQIKALGLPSLLAAFWAVAVGLILGFLLFILADVDIGTAFFAAAPGGMSEMSSLAMMYGFDVPTVVLLQFLRIAMVYFSIPLVASYFAKKSDGSTKIVFNKENGVNPECEEKSYPLIFTIFIGATAGLVAWKTNIPGGAIVGSLVAVGACKSSGVNLKTMPKKHISIYQIGLGASLGLTFTPEVASSISGMLGIIVLFSFLTVLNGIILGIIMHKKFGIDLTTSLLACAMAGVSQMSAIALEMDADSVVVSIIQTIRLTSILLIFPPIVLYFIG